MERPEHDSIDGAHRLVYGPNTNLEQISDWLTKILVGVWLTQIGDSREGLSGLQLSLAPAFGSDREDPASGVFAVALALYFALSGFLYSYLWTRLNLRRALTQADLPEIARRATQAVE